MVAVPETFSSESQPTHGCKACLVLRLMIEYQHTDAGTLMRSSIANTSEAMKGPPPGAPGGEHTALTFFLISRHHAEATEA